MPPFFIRFKTRSRQKRGICKSFPKTDKSKNHRNAEENQTNSPASAASTKRFKSILSHFFSLPLCTTALQAKKPAKAKTSPATPPTTAAALLISAASSPKAAPKPKNSSGPKMNRYSYQLICLKTSKVTSPSIRFIPVM